MIDQNDALRLKALVQEMSEILSEQDSQPPEPGPVEPPAKAITHVILESLSDKPQEVMPFTFGQMFKVGAIKRDSGIAGRFDNGDMIPLQFDVKALHGDGSVRHAIISGISGPLFGKEQRKMELVPAKPGTGAPVVPSSVPNGSVRLKVDGVEYSTNAALLSNPIQWLSGPEVGELQALIKLADSKGKEHPHLTVRVGYRQYRSKHVRVELVIENNWAYEPNPQNFVYDVVMQLEGKNVFDQKALAHFHHARWRKVFWIGEEPKMNVKHDVAYLIETRAVANYDQSAAPTEEILSALDKDWAGEKIQLMRVGMAQRHMPDTGGRRDIGLLPGWNTAWLLSRDARAAKVALGTADLAGSWPMHYRDKDTGQPISIIDHPYMTILGRQGDTNNPKTNKSEAFPSVQNNNVTVPHTFETSHHPSIAYLPYLLTGELYYLEELQFTAMYVVFSTNPNYREREKGLIWRTQVRGQAWSLRSLLEAAYITPDDDRLKQHFIGFVNNNLDWYNARYPDNKDANKLGILDNPDATNPYQNGAAVAGWQHDFFTSVIGRAVDMGFPQAEKMLGWLSQFTIGRMVGKGVCMEAAASYSFKVRDNSSSPFYTNMREVYAATVDQIKPGTSALLCGPQVAAALASGLQQYQGDMTGYPTSTEGYPSNLQPALARVSELSPAGKKAWAMFDGRKEKADYRNSSQFAILPW